LRKIKEQIIIYIKKNKEYINNKEINIEDQENNNIQNNNDKEGNRFQYWHNYYIYKIISRKNNGYRQIDMNPRINAINPRNGPTGQ